MLNKVNTKFAKLIDKMIDLINDDNSDFETRSERYNGDKMIVVNIKDYNWLSNDEIESAINMLHTQPTEEQIELIMEEFDERRLRSIYEHSAEESTSWIKEKYEGNADLENPDSKKAAWKYAFGEVDSCPLENYRSIKYLYEEMKAYPTFDSWAKYINSKPETIEYYNRKMIDFEIWQTGRSGGYLTICNTSEINPMNIYDNALNNARYCFDTFEKQFYAAKNSEDDKIFNQFLDDVLYIENYKEKIETIENLKYYIAEHEKKVNYLKTVVAYIEEKKKCFFDSVKTKLYEEIEEFMIEIGNPDEANVQIYVDETGELIKTTLGVSVQAKTFIEAYQNVLPSLESMKDEDVLKIGRRVGNYFVERAIKRNDDILIKAGCHRFSFNQISQTLKTIHHD